MKGSCSPPPIMPPTRWIFRLRLKIDAIQKGTQEVNLRISHVVNLLKTLPSVDYLTPRGQFYYRLNEIGIFLVVYTISAHRAYVSDDMASVPPPPPSPPLSPPIHQL